MEKEKQEIMTHDFHLLSDLCLAVLFGTFAISTQGTELGIEGLGLTIAIVIVCLFALINEYYHYKVDQDARKHALDGIAFFFMTLGCIELSVHLCIHLFHANGLPKVMNLLPTGSFVIATFLFTISVIISYRQAGAKVKTRAIGPYLFQTVGATLLFVGAVQANGFSTVLPNAGKSLTDLRMSITFFSAFAAYSAFMAMLFECQSFAMKQNLKSKNASSTAILVK